MTKINTIETQKSNKNHQQNKDFVFQRKARLRKKEKDQNK
jgi:hypothetical protein